MPIYASNLRCPVPLVLLKHYDNIAETLMRSDCGEIRIHDDTRLHDETLFSVTKTVNVALADTSSRVEKTFPHH